MNAKQMKEMGAEHANRGGKLCPSELMQLDSSIHSKAKELFYDAGNMDIRPIRFYNEMRGAFNKGWQEAYFKKVSCAS